jgi:lipopolysaccharide exporter
MESYWLRSGMYSFMERISAMIFGFGSFFFLVRVLTKEEFGVYALFLTSTAFIEVARNGLIQNAQIKYLTTADEKDKSTITTASFVLNVILTFFSVGVIFLLAELASRIWEASLLKPMFYIYTLVTILLIPFSQFNFVQQANLDFKGIFYSNFIRQGFLFLYIFTAFWFEFEILLLDLVWVMAVGAAFASLIAYFFVKNYLLLSSKIDWLWVKKLFHFGKFVFGTNVSSMFFKSIDQMMLGGIISTASVAIYNTAIRISNLVEVPTTSVAAVVFPESAKKMALEGKKAVKELYEKSVAAIFALILPGLLFVLVFPEFVILVVAGEKYLDTVPILQVTILYSLFIPFQRQFGTVMDSIGKPKLNFFIIFTGAGVNVISNYLFIINFGVIGAAFGSLTSYFIIFVANQIILYKHLNIQTLNVFRNCIGFYIDAWQIIKIKAKKTFLKSG